MRSAFGTILVLILFSNCPLLQAQNYDLNSLRASDIGAAAADAAPRNPLKPRKPSPLPEKEWTVMVFMNAKNNLSESQYLGLVGRFDEKNIAQMKKVGTTDAVNVVLEHGRKGKGSRRLLISKRGLFDNGETVYGEYPDADMGDYKRLIDFIRWTKTTFPARHYMLVLWNHGSGWIDPVKAPAAGGSLQKGILFDDETGNFVRTSQLNEVFRQSGYVDIFAMNACLMQMAEVAYEVKDYTGLILASEEVLLAQGFDYEVLLKFMNANPAFTAEQFSGYMTAWYTRFIAAGIKIGPVHAKPNGIGATLSAVRSGALNGLPARLDAFSGAVMANNETEAVKKAITSAMRFGSLSVKTYVDLYDFASIVGANAASSETKRAAAALTEYIRTELVVSKMGMNSEDYDFSKAGGIAINMAARWKPDGEAGGSETSYSSLALAKASQWDEFVAWTGTFWQPR